MAGVTGVICYFKHVDINFGEKVKIWRGVFLYGRGNDEDYEDDKDETNHNSANFEATTSTFCMVIDLNETYRMMMKIKLF